MAYGSSQATGRIRAVAAGLYHSYSNARSEPSLQPTPQLTIMPDPQPTEWAQDWTRILIVIRFVTLEPRRELLNIVKMLILPQINV